LVLSIFLGQLSIVPLWITTQSEIDMSIYYHDYKLIMACHQIEGYILEFQSEVIVRSSVG
jgi:hypothetical protein